MSDSEIVTSEKNGFNMMKASIHKKENTKSCLKIYYPKKYVSEEWVEYENEPNLTDFEWVGDGGEPRKTPPSDPPKVKQDRLHENISFG